MLYCNQLFLLPLLWVCMAHGEAEKTSLLNMVIEQIERSSTDVGILRFNPWLCSDPKQLITQFFKQLASAIKMKKPTADTVCELVRSICGSF